MPLFLCISLIVVFLLPCSLSQAVQANDDAYLYNKKHVINTDFYVLYDKNDSGKPLKLYDNNHNLLKYISFGRGPGELSNVLYKTIAVNYTSEKIYVWDQTYQQLNTYDFNLTHIESIVAPRYCNLLMWVKEQEILVSLNDEGELYTYWEMTNEDLSEITSISPTKNRSYFNNYTLRQNAKVTVLENQSIAIAYSYLNTFHILNDNDLYDLHLGSSENFDQHDIKNPIYELPYYGLNPMGVLDIASYGNTVTILFSEKKVSKIKMALSAFGGLNVENIIEKSTRLFIYNHSEQILKEKELINPSRYIISVNPQFIITSNEGKTITTYF
jgi:hypothetical protein